MMSSGGQIDRRDLHTQGEVMTHRNRMWRWAYGPTALFAAILLAAAGLVAPVEADEHLATVETVVAGGLNNPRGITIGEDGSLFVAESGSGGDQAVTFDDGGTVCVGQTGAVARIRGGQVERIATFPSYAEADESGSCSGDGAGIAAVGPSGIDIDANKRIGVTVGLGGDLAFRDSLPAEIADQLGVLSRIEHDGSVSVIADMAAFEEQRDPDGAGADSNPYGLTATHHNRWIAVDAGGNDLLEIEPSGVIRRFITNLPRLDPAPFTPPSCFADLPPEVQAQFPPEGAMIPPDPVPTSVAVGPDGLYYVALLSGFPFAPGTAAVYRVSPETGRFDPYLTGLSNVIDIAVGPGATLYILQLTDGPLLDAEICDNAAAGSLTKVVWWTKEQTLLTDELPIPGGVAVDAYGNAYVTTLSVLPGAGGVVKVTPTLQQGEGWG